MPIYCETALNTLGSFPAEPVNALSSFAPVIFGVLALIFLIRNQHTSKIAYTLAVLTVLTGLGSVAWHALRTPLTLFLDWLPGAIYLLIIVFFWAYHAGGRYLGLFLLIALSGLVFLVPFPIIREYRLFIITGMMVIAAGLLVGTWIRKRRAFSSAAWMMGAAAIAVSLRTIDLSVCDTIPIGTHFFWHIFLGLAAYAGVRMMVLLKADGPTAGIRPTGPAPKPTP